MLQLLILPSMPKGEIDGIFSRRWCLEDGVQCLALLLALMSIYLMHIIDFNVYIDELRFIVEIYKLNVTQQNDVTQQNYTKELIELISNIMDTRAELIIRNRGVILSIALWVNPYANREESTEKQKYHTEAHMTEC